MQRARGQIVGQQLVQPVCRRLHPDVAIAVLVEETPAVEFETNVVEPVRHRVDGIVAKQPRARPVVLHQVETGLLAVLVVTVQARPAPYLVVAQPGIDVVHVQAADLPVVGHPGLFDRLDDHPVHPVRRQRTFVDLAGRDPRIQPFVCSDHVNQQVQTGAGRPGHVRVHPGIHQRAVRQVVLEQTVQPVGHGLDTDVAVAVLVEKTVAVNLKAQVVDAVRHRVHRVVAKQPALRAVVLHQMEAGLLAVLVVTVQPCPVVEPVALQPGIHIAHVGHVQRAVIGHAGLGDRLDDQPVHVGRRVGALDELAGRDPSLQPLVGDDPIDQLIQPGAGRAVDQVGIHRLIRQRAIRQVVCQQVVQPVGQGLDADVAVAVLVEKTVAIDLKAQVVDAVRHRVHRVVRIQPALRAVVLHQVKSGLLTVLVVTVQPDPAAQLVLADPLVQVAYVRHPQLAVVRQPGLADRVHDHLVHVVRRTRSRNDLVLRQPVCQTPVVRNQLHQTVQTRAGHYCEYRRSGLLCRHG